MTHHQGCLGVLAPNNSLSFKCKNSMGALGGILIGFNNTEFDVMDIAVGEFSYPFVSKGGGTNGFNWPSWFMA